MHDRTEVVRRDCPIIFNVECFRKQMQRFRFDVRQIDVHVLVSILPQMFILDAQSVQNCS